MNKINPQVEVSMISVNLQQGLILNNGSLVAAYSKYKRTIWVKSPWTLNDIVIPDWVKTEIGANVAILVGVTDSFGLTMWTKEGHKDIN